MASVLSKPQPWVGWFPFLLSVESLSFPSLSLSFRPFCTPITICHPEDYGQHYNAEEISKDDSDRFEPVCPISRVILRKAQSVNIVWRHILDVIRRLYEVRSTQNDVFTVGVRITTCTVFCSSPCPLRSSFKKKG